MKRLTVAIATSALAILTLTACAPEGEVVKRWKEPSCQGSEAGRCPPAYWLLIVTAWDEEPIPVSVTKAQYRACTPLDDDKDEYPACLKGASR